MTGLTLLLLYGGFALFCVGLVGLVVRRNLIVMFLCLELMLLGVALAFVGFGVHHKSAEPTVMVIMMLTVAACEAAIALALFLRVFRLTRSLDVDLWTGLGEEPTELADAAAVADPNAAPTTFAKLAAAGPEPLPNRSEDKGAPHG